MSGTDDLRRDIDRALARLDMYETVLQNIAGGHWNAGRDIPIPVEMYAREALSSWFFSVAVSPSPLS